MKPTHSIVFRVSDYNEKDVSIRTLPRERVFVPNTIAAIAK